MAPMRRLTHIDRNGRATMVNVAPKEPTARFAVAGAEVRMSPATLRAIRAGRTTKGNVLEVARIAGIAAAKQTSALIPLCHPIALTQVAVDVALRPPGGVEIRARADAFDRTGVEMEALTAAAVCALTIYDMCKALDRAIEIRNIRLLEKAGGRSGHYVAGKANAKRKRR
jgi:cyclic pyranopterin monophosphate synthase